MTDNATLIVILKSGTRLTYDWERQGRDLAWIRNGLREAGKRMAYTAESFHSSILIIGTEVHQYNGNETREVLGLE